MAKTIKEIIILLLVCLITMLLFAIIFYNYIPSRKVVAEVSTYSTSEGVQQLLADDIDSKENEVVLTYEVTSSDLSTYQVTNDYVPGKANPFAAIEDDEKTTNSTPANTTTSKSETTEGQAENTTKNDTNEEESNETSKQNAFEEETGTK